MQTSLAFINILLLFLTSFNVFMNHRICKAKLPAEKTVLNKIFTALMILSQLCAYILMWSILAAYFQGLILFPIWLAVLVNYIIIRYKCKDIRVDDMLNFNSTIMTPKYFESHSIFWTYVISGWISPCSVIFDYFTISKVKNRHKLNAQKFFFNSTYIVNFSVLFLCLLILLLLKYLEVEGFETTFDCHHNNITSKLLNSWNHIGTLTGNDHLNSSWCDGGEDKTILWFFPSFFFAVLVVCISWLSLRFIGMLKIYFPSHCKIFNPSANNKHIDKCNFYQQKR